MPKYLEKSREYIVFLLAFIFGILIWSLSSLVTGQIEPWDSNDQYYIVSLFVSGAVCGAINPERYSRWVVAIYLGQLIALPFTDMGAYIVLGAMSLAIFSIVTFAGAALAAYLVVKPKNINENNE